ncbi:VOC family protein [Halobium palmae]|uniref:VOC family protein n=1 Tax=Halobium palmae TaxID=1776492 RepID=A0ABD5S1E4_9EURY
MTHAISWFEIPTTEFDRAVDFYATVLDSEISEYSPEDGDDYDHETYGRAATFPVEEGEVGGMLVEIDEFTSDSGETIHYAPASESGIVVYLSVDGDLDDALARVESAGGEVVVPTQSLEEMEGHWAMIVDSEGNRVGLMSTE